MCSYYIRHVYKKYIKYPWEDQVSVTVFFKVLGSGTPPPARSCSNVEVAVPQPPITDNVTPGGRCWDAISHKKVHHFRGYGRVMKWHNLVGLKNVKHLHWWPMKWEKTGKYGKHVEVVVWKEASKEWYRKSYGNGKPTCFSAHHAYASLKCKYTKFTKEVPLEHCRICTIGISSEEHRTNLSLSSVGCLINREGLQSPRDYND